MESTGASVLDYATNTEVTLGSSNQWVTLPGGLLYLCH